MTIRTIGDLQDLIATLPRDAQLITIGVDFDGYDIEFGFFNSLTNEGNTFMLAHDGRCKCDECDVDLAKKILYGEAK